MNEFARKAMELADEAAEAKSSLDLSMTEVWRSEGYRERLAKQLDAARAALLAHLEGAEQKPSDSLKDSLRLDWCERHAVGIENNRDIDGSSVWDVFGPDNSSGKTLRAAIDAAALPATPTEDQP